MILVMVVWGSCELVISSCDTTGRAFHPPVAPIMNNDNNNNDINVFWRIMAFFESYADLQVSFLQSMVVHYYMQT